MLTHFLMVSLVRKSPQSNKQASFQISVKGPKRQVKQCEQGTCFCFMVSHADEGQVPEHVLCTARKTTW